VFDAYTTLNNAKLGRSENAVSASKLASAVSIALGGDLLGSATFDGTSSITINATIKDDSHNHTIANIDGLQAALDAKLDGNGGKATDSDKLDGYDSSHFIRSFQVEDGDGTEVSITHGKELKFVEGGNIDINFTDTSSGSDADPYDLSFSVPNASTSTRGAVQLSTSVSSTSTVEAATPSAVKAAYDLAASKLAAGAKAADSEKLDGLDSTAFLRSNADDSLTGDLNLVGAALSATEKGLVHVLRPQGAMYETHSATVTGALAITLPVSWSSTMMSFWIDIYEYGGDTLGESLSLFVGGYNYSTTPSWNNVFAKVISSRTDKNYSVRFGHDGSKCVVYIGETGTTWSYPQVMVRDFMGGFNAGDNATWADGWDISFATTLGTHLKHVNASLVATTAEKLSAARTISLGGDLSGSTSFDGSANVTINAVVKDDSHNHTIANVDGLQAALDAKLDGNGGKATDSDKLDGYDSSHFIRSFQVEDGDGTEVSITHGKELKFVEGGNIDINFTDTSNGSDAEPYDLTFSVPNASTSARGAVQLSSAVNSTSTSIASTASATKQAFDKAVAAESNAKNYTDSKMSELLGDAPAAHLDTIRELGDALTDNESAITAINTEIAKKMDIHEHPYRSNTWMPSKSDIGLGNVPNYAASDTYTSSGTNLATRKAVYDAYTALNGSKLGKSENAVSATKLATARTISLAGDLSGSASFDGTGNISISATVGNDSHYHSQVYIQDTRGDSRAPSYYPDRYVSYDFQQDIDTGAGNDTWHVLQTVAKWSSYDDAHCQEQLAYTGENLKHRVATSDAAWGAWKTIAYTSDNVASASKLASARAISLVGDLSGSATFDGSANVSITVAIKDDSHNHIIANVDGLQSALEGKAAASHSHSYLPLGGGTMTGNITFSDNLEGISWARNTDGAHIRFKNDSDSDTNSYLEFATFDNGNEYFKWTVDEVEEMSLKSDGLRVVNSIYEAGVALSNKYLGKTAKAADSEKIDGYDSSQLMRRLDNTTDYKLTGNIMSCQERGNVLPVGLSSGYPYGTLLTFNDSSSRFRLYAPHHEGGYSALYVSTGWGSDSKVFERLLTWRDGDGRYVQQGDSIDNAEHAVSASKLATARTISLGGDLSGSTSFDGSANATISATVIDNSHNHTTLTGITKLGFAAQGTDAASITTTISSTSTFFDFNLSDDNGNDWWRWRFTPSGSSVYDAMTLKPVSNGNADLTVSGKVTADAFQGNASSATWADTVDVNVSSSTSFYNMVWHSGDALFSSNGVVQIRPSDKYMKFGSAEFSGAVDLKGGLKQDGHSILNGTDTWLRTSGNTGWYSATHGGGMYMTDSTWVRTYSSKKFRTDNTGTDAVYTAGGVKAEKGFFWGTQSLDDRYIRAGNVRILGTGTGNDYNAAAFEARGNGSSNTVKPTIGFHQPNVFAGSIRQENASEFRFYKQGATSYANVRAGTFYGALSGNASTATWADQVDVNTSASTSFYGVLWHSGDTVYASENQGFTVRPSDGFVKMKHGYLSNGYLQHSSDGTLVCTNTNKRTAGMYGTYDSTRIGHIWSMGTAYKIHDSGTNFGGLYGLAYKHTNNTTGGTMAGGHQMVWCAGGTPRAAMGDNIWTSGNVTAYSDRRVKTNIEPIENALEKVEQLGGYTFDRVDVENEDGTPVRQTGVIAQEVQAVLPEAVMQTGEDEHLSVAYGNMVGLLIEAVKELKTEVADLKEQLNNQ
jgi:hypothetical protein